MVQVIAVSLTPFIIWVIGIHYQNRKAKNDAKRTLFFPLMKNRKNSIIPKERVDALNLIDVVFQDDNKVRKAWKEYLDSLNAKSPNHDNNNAFLLDLLSEMAISLGYKSYVKQRLIAFMSLCSLGMIERYKRLMLTSLFVFFNRLILSRSRRIRTNERDTDFLNYLSKVVI